MRSCCAVAVLWFHRCDLLKYVGQGASSEADALLRDGRQEQQQLIARNKILQSESVQLNDSIHELNHTIARRRQELQVYEVKLKDWSRREEIALDVRPALQSFLLAVLVFSLTFLPSWKGRSCKERLRLLQMRGACRF